MRTFKTRYGPKPPQTQQPQATAPPPLPPAHRTVRWDTVAAIASAIGAVASAAIAAYALLFFVHQEDIARNQLEATYQSNVYSKQVDSLAALQVALNNFQNSPLIDDLSIGQTMLYSATLNDDMIDKYQTSVIKDRDLLIETIPKISVAAEELALISPDPIRNTLGELFRLLYEIRATMFRYAIVKMHKDDVQNFSTDTRKLVDEVSSLQQDLERCFGDSLPHGYPLTEDRVKDCQLPSPHKRSR
jgi:hypothetical protein